jgi:hypothetical protein
MLCRTHFTAAISSFKHKIQIDIARDCAQCTKLTTRMPCRTHFTMALSLCKRAVQIEAAFQTFNRITAAGEAHDNHSVSCLIGACGEAIRALRVRMKGQDDSDDARPADEVRAKLGLSRVCAACVQTWPACKTTRLSKTSIRRAALYSSIHRHDRRSADDCGTCHSARSNARHCSKPNAIDTVHGSAGQPAAAARAARAGDQRLHSVQHARRAPHTAGLERAHSVRGARGPACAHV